MRCRYVGVDSVTADSGSAPQVDLLDDLGVGVVRTDLAGTIEHWSEGATRLCGRGSREMLGSSITALRSSHDPLADGSAVRDLLSTGRWRGVMVIADADGEPLRLDVRARVLVDGAERPRGFEAFSLDVSGRVEAEQRAAVAESRASLTDRIVGLVAWEWSPLEDRLVTSDAFTSLLGLEPGTELSMADSMAVMPPEDRERVRAGLDGMINGGADALSVGHRVLASDGSVRWLEAHCLAVRDPAGVVIHVSGVTQDVTARRRDKDRLQEAEAFWLATLDSLSAHIAVLDEHGTVVAVNRAWRAFSEREGGASDYVGSNYIAVCEAEAEPSAEAVAGGLRELIAGRRDEFAAEYACHGPSAQRWFLLRATRYVGSGPPRIVVLHADITERHHAQEQALIQAALLDEIDVAVIVTDPQLRVLNWNAGAERLYGWTAEEALGRDSKELVVPADAGSTEPIIEALRRNGRWDGEYVVRRKDGSTFPAYVRNRVIADQDGRVQALIGVSMDISARRESERALLSARDYLRAVTDSMGQGVLTQDRDGQVSYLNQVATGLLGWSQEEIQGRLMHDLVHNRRVDGSPLPLEDSPILRARRDGEVVRVEDDIFIRKDGSELPVAYTAAPFATNSGIEGCVVVFEDITERKVAERRVSRDLKKLAWVDHIQAALSEDGFVLHAQPIIDLATGDVVQHELLLRMRSLIDPAVLIAPGAFLPVAEEYGLVTEIDRWVIDRSVEIAATGRSVQVNVSARSIGDPSLVDYIRYAIDRTRADPATMVFEITETTLASNEAAARAFVTRLHDLGCRVALDDFGTGYGGFTYLKQLPIDYLKIDIEFVGDLFHNAASRHVVRGIVNLAQAFGMQTVGEGVEDQATLELLAELEVDYAQGFHIGRPSQLRSIRQPHYA